MPTITVTPGQGMYDDIERRGDLADAPDLTVTGIGHHGKLFRPRVYSITFRAVADRWTVVRVRVVGEVLKKDGTVGQNVAQNEYRALADAPAWVRTLVDAVRPEEPTPLVYASTFTIDLDDDGSVL